MKASLILGPPGAGKGTQASLASQRLGMEIVSTGAMFRAEIASGSVLGQKVKEVVNAGKLVADDLLFEIVRAKLAQIKLQTPNAHLLLDGVTRTLAQVGQLDTLVAANILSLHRVLALTAPLEKLIQRFANRWTCKNCGAVHSISESALALQMSCSQCGAQGMLYRRDDDLPETVTTRFQVYQESTAPLMSVYSTRGILLEIDALRPPEEVYVDFAGALLKCD